MRQLPRLQWWVWALVCLVGLAITILAVWKLPSLLYGDVTQASPDARLQAASGFRTAFVAGLAGLAALGSLAIATRTYRLTQQGQITDRYTKAIEQLGSDKLDVRLGGIYALERIATDSERDHPTVVEVLSAFAREHDQPDILPSTVGDDSHGLVAPPPRPTTDVQAAVTVLGRLPQRRGVTRANLREAHLEEAYLERADLQGAHLTHAHLQGAFLEEASLQEAHLQGAYLQSTYLAGASLQGAHLAGAELERAVLEGASLQEAHLQGADLRRADLRGARLEGADLRGAYLQSAYLKGATLDGVQLQRAKCDADTGWPDGFDWRAAGVLLADED